MLSRVLARTVTGSRTLLRAAPVAAATTTNFSRRQFSAYAYGEEPSSFEDLYNDDGVLLLEIPEGDQEVPEHLQYFDQLPEDQIDQAMEDLADDVEDKQGLLDFIAQAQNYEDGVNAKILAASSQYQYDAESGVAENLLEESGVLSDDVMPNQAPVIDFSAENAGTSIYTSVDTEDLRGVPVPTYGDVWRFQQFGGPDPQGHIAAYLEVYNQLDAKCRFNEKCGGPEFLSLWMVSQEYDPYIFFKKDDEKVVLLRQAGTEGVSGSEEDLSPWLQVPAQEAQFVDIAEPLVRTVDGKQIVQSGEGGQREQVAWYKYLIDNVDPAAQEEEACDQCGMYPN